MNSTTASLSDQNSLSQGVRILGQPLHFLMKGLFSVYIRARRAKNKTGYELSAAIHVRCRTDYAKRLNKKPKHLSAILKAQKHPSDRADTQRLIAEAAELAVWCASANIHTLSVYDKHGLLKENIPEVYETIQQRFRGCSITLPVSIHSPHNHPYTFDNVKGSVDEFKLYLIAEEDGRGAIVHVTQILTGRVHSGEISFEDVSVELMHAELQSMVMPDPDLLVLFGPYLELSGYPPWPSRLLEMSYLKDNEGFKYQVFLNALQEYSGAEMREGK